jgi:cell division topological specificity factor
MALLDFFLSRKKNTANIAKERLQIIVAERRRSDAEPHYLPQLRKDILEVICKYVQIDPEMVTVQLEQKDGDISILELNVTLPEAEESRPEGCVFIAPVSAAPPGKYAGYIARHIFLSRITVQQRIQAIGHQFPAPACHHLRHAILRLQLPVPVQQLVNLTT